MKVKNFTQNFMLIVLFLVTAGISVASAAPFKNNPRKTTSASKAETPSGVINKASVAPEIDGAVDDVWDEANTYDIDKNFQSETPTLGFPGDTNWKALWTSEGVYVLVSVTDDVFYPTYASPDTTIGWLYDKPEIYLDVNSVLADGLGSKDKQGHYQIAPSPNSNLINGTAVTLANGVVYAFLVNDPNYTVEYFIPFSLLLDKDGNTAETTRTIGFDVTVIDRDTEGATRQRAVWANVGANNESFIIMDDCGLVTFNQEGPTGIDDKIVRKNSMNIYPNPVGNGNELTVSLTSKNERVSIYNTIGQMLMEKVTNGNKVKFDVSNLRNGMYIVKLSAGTSQKFIK